MNEKTKMMCSTIICVTGMLTIGELLGKVVTRPIAAWRSKMLTGALDKLINIQSALDEYILDREDKKTEAE